MSGEGEGVGGDRTPISSWARAKQLNEEERATLRGLLDGPGIPKSEKATRHLAMFGLIAKAGPPGCYYITDAGRRAVSGG